MEASCSNEWSNKKFSRTALPCHYKDTAQIKGNESPEKKSCSWIEKFQLDVSQSRSSVENTMKASIICLVVLVAVGLKSCLSAVGVGLLGNGFERRALAREVIQLRLGRPEIRVAQASGSSVRGQRRRQLLAHPLAWLH